APKTDKKQKAKKSPQPEKVKQEHPKQPKVRTPEQRAKNSAKARAKRKAKRETAFNILLALFPEIFNIESPKPFKIGIDRDLLKLAAKRKLEITNKQISKGLYFYIDTVAYQKALFEGSSRFDLNGQPCGEVSDKQRERAKKKLDELQASK
ncbi:MAG TPA: ProQ/FINO family protein, partial [Arsenophonus nasoniae]|uniref:ProQ/FINO family protein n=1 Tax=Arsenophonus nasoniae TaxID=638 RepID=UPI00387A6BAD